MKTQELSPLTIADLCRELAMLLHAGVRTDEGLTLMAEEEKDKDLKALLNRLADETAMGNPLSAAFSAAERFPSYVTGLLRVGEQAGRTEETLRALARYYEEQDRMKRYIRSVLTYPAMLLVLMLVVIIVLLSRVLPVFNDIYASLGGRLTGVAGGLLAAGQVLDRALPVLCIVLAVGFVAALVCSVSPKLLRGVKQFLRTRWGDRGILRKQNNVRFVQALSLGYSSGLTPEDAMGMAAELLKDIPAAAARCETCRTRLEQGENLSDVLGDTGVLSASACRLLSLGMRGGNSDEVLEEIAQRMSEESQQAIEDKISGIEPALVLVTSVLVGVILLSVMLPLMNIMAAIG